MDLCYAMAPLRGFLLFMPATLVILGAPKTTKARHYASSTLLRVETDSVAPKVDPPRPSAVDRLR